MDGRRTVETDKLDVNPEPGLLMTISRDNDDYDRNVRFPLNTLRNRTVYAS